MTRFVSRSQPVPLSSPGRDTPPIRLMPFPRRSANPYLEGLYGALTRQGIHVLEDERFFSRALIGERPDFVHYHWPENQITHHLTFRQLDRAAWFFARLCAQRASGARVLFTFHNLGAHEAAWPALHRWARHRMVAMSDSVLVNFESARSTLREEFGRSKDVWHVPHGNYRGLYPDSVSRKQARRTLLLPEDARTFLLFGDLRGYKNADLAIDAFRRLAAENARLLIAGQPRRPQEGARLRRLAEADRRIVLHADRVPDSDVQLYFRASDVLLLPREAFSSGTAVLAFDFGLPILAPRKHHIAELARGEACFDLTDLSVHGITRAMESLVTQDLRKARRDAARCTADLGWDGIGKDLAARLKESLILPPVHA